MKRWVKRPEGSNWGDFGPDDQTGRMNLITPERRLAAVREVKEGRTFVLSLPLDIPGGKGLYDVRTKPKLFAGTFYNRPLADVLAEIEGSEPQRGCVDLGCDDGVSMHLQFSTQWDGFSHVGAFFDADGDGTPEKVYYNGWRGNEDFVSVENGGPYARALGIENMAVTCVQGRGVLIDLVREFGAARQVIGYDSLMRAIDKQNVEIKTGDMVCLRTGFAEALLDMGHQLDRARMKTVGAVIDGADKALQQFIDDSGIAAICADNSAVEAGLSSSPTPVENGYTLMPLHHHCLFKLGIHLGELWYFRDLAAWLEANGRSSFLLTAPPLRLPGSVGSPATPVATV